MKVHRYAPVGLHVHTCKPEGAYLSTSPYDGTRLPVNSFFAVISIIASLHVTTPFSSLSYPSDITRRHKDIYSALKSLKQLPLSLDFMANT